MTSIKKDQQIQDGTDLGNYPSNQKMYDTTNKKVLGQFKSEETFEITDLCGLKPTCNAYKVYTGEEFEEHKKAKGVLRNKKRYALWKICQDTEWKHKKKQLHSMPLEVNTIKYTA